MLCVTFCSYFKPGKDEKLACRGYDVVNALMRKGRTIIFEKSALKINPVMLEMIVQKMCMTCDFHKQDCDFMQDRTAPPCGGFALLAQLLNAGEITIEDLG